MRLGDLLDADVSVLGPKLLEGARAGFDWWIGELRDMAPAALRTSGVGSGRPVAERDDDGDYVLVRRDGRASRHAPGRVAVQVALGLPAQAVLTRIVQAPPLPDRDLRRMMALDIDRLTPFRAEDVYLAVARQAAEDASGARAVLIGVTPRAVADLALADARAAGLEPSALIAAGEGGQALDFLPAMRAGGAAGRAGGAAGPWWALVAVLVAVNVGGWIWRDSRGLSELQAAVAAQQPQVQRVAALRAALSAEAERRRVLSQALAADEPLRALDAASKALPDAAWVQRATFGAGSIRLAGYHRPGVDVVAALKRDPLFANVQSASSDPGTASEASPAGGDPFDVSADLAAPLAGTR